VILKIIHVNKNQLANIEQQYIRRLIAEGENQQVDFKFAINDSRKIARTLVAFANTDGGKLLVGVKDNGSIAGVRSDEEYYMVEAAANMYCKPAIPFNVKKWIVDKKTILEISIQHNSDPSFAKDENGKWMAYIRVNDQNILANRILIEVWKRKKKLRGTFIEYSKNENMLLSYLSVDKKITLSKFTRISKLTVREAEKILINLLCLDIIQMELSEKGAMYSLKKL
jgi:predicted HTH transcriptional regulator